MFHFWRPTLLYLIVYLFSLKIPSVAQNSVLPDVYLQVWWGTATTTFSTSGYFLLSPSTRIVTNPTTIYAPCGTEWWTTRQIMTVITDEYGQIQIRDEPVLTSGWPPLTPPLAGFPSLPPMTRPTYPDMDTTCRAVFTQLVQAYGTTAIFEEGDAIPLTIEINPTSIFSPIAPEWTIIRKIITSHSRVEYLRTQTRDEPILISMGDSPAEFTLTTSRWWIPLFRRPTTPKGQLLGAYGTTTWFGRTDTRSQSPIIEINTTPIYGPNGLQWTTTREIITVVVMRGYYHKYISDEPILTSMDGPPAGHTLTAPPACTPPVSRLQAHMTSSMPLETALSTLTPPAQHTLVDAAPMPVMPLPGSLTPAPDPTTTPMWLLRTEL